jgi:hypothetical protein
MGLYTVDIGNKNYIITMIVIEAENKNKIFLVPYK